MQLIQRTPHVIMAIPGFTHSPAATLPLAEAIVRKYPNCRVIPFQLPSVRGKKFGEVSLEDYARAVIQAIQVLQRRNGIVVNELLGHSMGGLISLLAYQFMVDEGTNSLLQVTLLSSSSIPGIPWAVADSGAADALGNLYTFKDHPILGTHCAVPHEKWAELWFSLPDNGGLAPDTPSAKDIPTLNVIASGMMDDQLSRVRPAKVTEVRSGIFSNQTRLLQLVFKDDPFALVHEQQRMFEHLTDAKPGRHRFDIVSPMNSVHDLLVTQPNEVAELWDAYFKETIEEVSL